MDFYKILLMQLIYEINSGCTTVVTRVKDQNVLFRTMDWPLKLLSRLTIKLRVIKNKQYLCSVVTWLGCVGWFTAFNGSTAVMINYKSGTSILSSITKTMKLYYPVSYLVRTCYENNYSYNKIIRTLKHTNIISPCYYTVFNTKEDPIVITRLPTRYDVRYNSYSVQTNCDDDKKRPNIMYSVERRKIIKDSIQKNNNNYNSYDELLRDFAISPIINVETIYITQIDEKNNFKTYIIS